MHHFRFLAALTILVLAACGSSASDVATEPTPETVTEAEPIVLSGTYRSRTIEHRTTGEPQPFTVRLRFKDGSINVWASGGCNNADGTFEVNERGRLEVLHLGSTQMECDNASHDQDLFIQAFVRKNPEVLTTGDVLTLQNVTTYMELVPVETE